MRREALHTTMLAGFSVPPAIPPRGPRSVASAGWAEASPASTPDDLFPRGIGRAAHPPFDRRARFRRRFGNVGRRPWLVRATGVTAAAPGPARRAEDVPGSGPKEPGAPGVDELAPLLARFGSRIAGVLCLFRFRATGSAFARNGATRGRAEPGRDFLSPLSGRAFPQRSARRALAGAPGAGSSFSVFHSLVRSPRRAVASAAPPRVAAVPGVYEELLGPRRRLA